MDSKGRKKGLGRRKANEEKHSISSSMRLLTATRIVLGQCILPLGMEEGRIPDNAITASSSYETKSVGPQNARYVV